MTLRKHHFAVVISLLVVNFALAGLYDPTQPALDIPEALPHEIFRERWNDVISIGLPTSTGKFRRDALAERDALAAKRDLTPAERVRLGILRLRLQEIEPAMTEFQQALRGDPRNFWAITALGTAYQQTGQVAEAERYLGAAHELQPVELPPDAKTVEAMQLKLARLRLREQAGRSRSRPAPPEDIDDLFGMRFVGASGQYEAGNFDPAQKAKLPANAIAIVQQLLMWLPGDTRLYWLLGELYAANGDLESAQKVFDECLNARRLDARLLRQHRQAVMEAIAARQPPAPPAEADWKPSATRGWIAAAIAVPLILLLIAFQVRELRRRWQKRAS